MKEASILNLFKFVSEFRTIVRRLESAFVHVDCHSKTVFESPLSEPDYADKLCVTFLLLDIVDEDVW